MIRLACLALVAAASLGVGCAEPTPQPVRIATFNVSMVRPAAGGLAADLADERCDQAHKVAEIIQRVRPDVLLLCEFDYDPNGEALTIFCRDYLGVDHGPAKAIAYPYRYAGPSNTGLATGMDLDRDGQADGPGDAFGYGRFPGQYGLALLSRYPIETERVRTFRLLPWSAMPGNRIPSEWYTPEQANRLRLSSKSHWDVPIRLPGGVVHLLACHPTPPIFDGPEDRNGRRNFDELRLWREYIDLTEKPWLVDDAGGVGPLPPGAEFVILGDLNADPFDGDGIPGAIDQLLALASVIDPLPKSAGAAQAGQSVGDALDTAERGDLPALRLDYVLPSRNLPVVDSGVFWPASEDPLADLIDCSDHRLVWVDLFLPERQP